LAEGPGVAMMDVPLVSIEWEYIASLRFVEAVHLFERIDVFD
jgi:hypothetical protein